MRTRRDHIKMLTKFLERDMGKYEKFYLAKTGLTNVITLENRKMRNKIIKGAKKKDIEKHKIYLTTFAILKDADKEIDNLMRIVCTQDRKLEKYKEKEMKIKQILN